MRKRLIGLVVVLAILVSLAVPAVIFAVNPVVTITVTAQVVSITNSQNTWTMGTITENSIIYFSVDNLIDDNYSMITNTSNVAVDVEVRGTDLVPVDPTYTWTLAAASDNQDYQLYANSSNSSGAYNIEVKSAAAYNDLVVELFADETYLWSCNFTAPTAFHPADDGLEKAGSITLVATKHT
jgi:hypothetical protein